jgi:hypothetical protein
MPAHLGYDEYDHVRPASQRVSWGKPVRSQLEQSGWYGSCSLLSRAG